MAGSSSGTSSSCRDPHAARAESPRARRGTRILPGSRGGPAAPRPVSPSRCYTGRAPRTRHLRRDGRAVEGGGLENRSTGNRTGGSNPSPSATASLGTRSPEGAGFLPSAADAAPGANPSPSATAFATLRLANFLIPDGELGSDSRTRVGAGISPPRSRHPSRTAPVLARETPTPTGSSRSRPRPRAGWAGSGGSSRSASPGRERGSHRRPVRGPAR